jgi:hypothetical protein
MTTKYHFDVDTLRCCEVTTYPQHTANSYEMIGVRDTDEDLGYIGPRYFVRRDRLADTPKQALFLARKELDNADREAAFAMTALQHRRDEIQRLLDASDPDNDGT